MEADERAWIHVLVEGHMVGSSGGSVSWAMRPATAGDRITGLFTVERDSLLQAH